MGREDGVDIGAMMDDGMDLPMTIGRGKGL